MVRMIVVVACSLAVLSVGATAQDRWVSDDQYAEMQKNFAESTIAKTPMRWLQHLPRMGSESDQPLRGFHADIIVRDGDRATIMEEIVTIAAPGQ